MRLGSVVIMVLLVASLIYVPSLLRALTIPGVFDGNERNVISERMYVPNSTVTHIWFGIGTTKYLPYDPNDASTTFPIVVRIVREGWIDTTELPLIYANWDPDNFNKWEIYVKQNFRDMNEYDRYQITPHGWKLSTTDIDTSPYSITIFVSVGGKNIEAGFSVKLQPADSKIPTFPNTVASIMVG